ncbi:MAG: nitrous oxide reductase accessory protein NosL [Pseudomonadota bacterium]
MVKSARLATLLAVATLALAGCGQVDGAATGKEVALEIGPGTTCALDGMLLADYPGPKAQVRYEGSAEPEFFCDTVELFSALLRPEQVRPVKAAFVQDMAKADWEQPRGAWIPARDGWYVVGSRRHGSMGPTIASFAEEADARKFAAEHGGQVLPFAGVKPEMVDLSGGAQHDQKM